MYLEIVILHHTEVARLGINSLMIVCNMTENLYKSRNVSDPSADFFKTYLKQSAGTASLK